MGWMIAVIVMVVILSFPLFLGIAASSSARDVCSREEDDMKQEEYLREYSLKKKTAKARRRAWISGITDKIITHCSGIRSKTKKHQKISK